MILPASLGPPEWTCTQTPTTGAANDFVLQQEEAEELIMQNLRQALAELPLHVRQSLKREEVIGAIMEALSSGERPERMREAAASDTSRFAGFAVPSSWSTLACQPPVASSYPLLAALSQQEPRAAMPEYFTVHDQTGTQVTPVTANDWFTLYGGGLLPPGWTAAFDYRLQSWFFTNHNTLPPHSTWQDPRAFAFQQAPLLPTYHAPTTVHTREEADWLASQFGALEARRQYTEGLPGPVAAELRRERREHRELQDAIHATQQAAQEANEAAALGDADHFQAAQEAMVRARGKLDRLSDEARIRNALITPALYNYQGVTRGYDVDHAFLRPRTYYTDSRPAAAAAAAASEVPPIPSTTTTSFSGRIMAKLHKERVPNSLYMPTGYPLPPNVKYRASATPTPYAIPEFCFAWDMLLRNRRDPLKPTPFR